MGWGVTDSMNTPDAPDRGLPPVPEPSMAALAKSVRSLRNWLIVLSVLVALALAATAAAVVVASVAVASLGFQASSVSQDQITTGADADLVPGPPLTNVASLPVDASGEGTIQGVPTGEATASDTGGTFELVLDPAPEGLSPRTTLHVGFDHSTKVYRNGQAIGDALTAMNAASGPYDADPSAAGSVIVRFHIKDGRAFADRLDLADDYPSGIEP